MKKKINDCVDCGTDLMLLSPLAQRCRSCKKKQRTIYAKKGYHIRKYKKYVKNISKHINIEWEI